TKGDVEDLDLLLVEATAAQSDDIQGSQACAVADNAAERDDVGLHTGHAADHGGPADADELVNGRGAANNGVVTDADMTAHDGVVRDDDMAAQRAVMRDVDHRHQQTVGAHRGDSLACHGAAMDRAVLPHLGPGADHAAGWLALVFQVLRRQPYGAERKQHHARFDTGMALHHHMRHEARSVLDHHIRANGAKGADMDTGPDLGRWMNIGCRVDNHLLLRMGHDDFGAGIHAIEVPFVWLRKRGAGRLWAGRCATNSMIVARCFERRPVTPCFTWNFGDFTAQGG